MREYYKGLKGERVKMMDEEMLSDCTTACQNNHVSYIDCCSPSINSYWNKCNIFLALEISRS